MISTSGLEPRMSIETEMSYVFSFCSGFPPQSGSCSCHFSEEADVLAAFGFFKNSAHLLEETLPKVSAELLYDIRNGETISFLLVAYLEKGKL